MSYSVRLLDHLENPRNVGELPAPAEQVAVTNAACGDQIQLSLLIANDQIADARMRAYGCAPTLAAASVLTELVIGKTVPAASGLTSRDIVTALDGLPRGKQHAAELAIEALQTALAAHSEINY